MSEDLRKKGNELFKKASIPGISPVLRVQRHTDALKLYQQAYSQATDEEQRAAASKNIGVTSWKLALQQNDAKQIEQYHFKQAITNLSRALTHGSRGKPYDWSADVHDTLQVCIDEACSSNEHLPYRLRVGPMEEFIDCLLEDELKAQFYIRIVNELFKEAITNISVDGYKTALHHLRDCHRPLEEARRFANNASLKHLIIPLQELATSISGNRILSETNVLEEDIHMHICIAESIQARRTGDELLREQLMDEENVNMAMILDIMDWYKNAIIKTRELDVEQEAIALSRLGRVYDQILKKKYKAQENYHRSVQLALSMHPKTFNNDEWYIEATETLKRYQEEQVKQESLEWNKAREKFVKEAETELKKIKAEFEKGDLHFIKYIYEEFPPKKESHQLGDTEEKSLKSLFKTALIHYHPDRQKEHGEKWVVICEEICKLLTQRYEYYKA